ncbi:helix-turn-helix domain-containing protein [Paratissierella segnis]|uniref:Helix-turn-helix domain-containing protein n=1 Tax=Paratissierella segnis TaxID=2763679 RepID=A0A926EUU7_9FIRM|nr:helix-turn-helix domain-containing protein [Paratissierella segnis]MBC8588051.1 helix-turn-helix domain-containing protein [Paratissierella segnis]
MKMTVSEAAKLLGISPMGLRIALRQGRFSEFGEAWKNEEKWTYYINRIRLEKYLSKEA